jgi:(1->4)-alpha-D-glucan 1-alpha-D-glucosylmutase
VVPNHMAYTFENKLLMDVLENGQGSKYFPFFDIDWEHDYENLKGQILAPSRSLLGFSGRCRDSSGLRSSGAHCSLLRRRFPVRIQSYTNVFSVVGYSQG